MKWLKSNKIEPMDDPLYLSLGTNGRCNDSPHDFIYDIMWRASNVKIISFRGIYWSPCQYRYNKRAKSKEIRPMYDLVYPVYLLYPQLGTNGRIDKLSGLGVSYVIMGGTFNDKML